eukprot:5885105-Prymnesium_polylepis.1
MCIRDSPPTLRGVLRLAFRMVGLKIEADYSQTAPPPLDSVEFRRIQALPSNDKKRKRPSHVVALKLAEERPELIDAHLVLSPHCMRMRSTVLSWREDHGGALSFGVEMEEAIDDLGLDDPANGEPEGNPRGGRLRGSRWEMGRKLMSKDDSYTTVTVSLFGCFKPRTLQYPPLFPLFSPHSQELFPYDRAKKLVADVDARLHDGVADPKVSSVLQSAQEILNAMMAAVATQPDTSINGVSVRRKTTAYSRRHVVGRLSAVRASFMYLPNVFRQTLGRGYLRDFDFMRSYQKVAVGLLLLAGATPGEDLVAYAEGSDLVKQIVRYYGFYHKPKECAKVMIQVAFFNGDLGYASRKLHGFYGHPMPTLVQLQAQCVRARETILAMP